MPPQRSKKTPADSTQGAASPQNGAPEGEDQQEPGASKDYVAKGKKSLSTDNSLLKQLKAYIKEEMGRQTEDLIEELKLLHDKQRNDRFRGTADDRKERQKNTLILAEMESLRTEVSKLRRDIKNIFRIPASGGHKRPPEKKHRKRRKVRPKRRTQKRRSKYSSSSEDSELLDNEDSMSDTDETESSEDETTEEETEETEESMDEKYFRDKYKPRPTKSRNSSISKAEHLPAEPRGRGVRRSSKRTVTKGKRKRQLSLSDDEAEEPEYVEDDTDNETERIAKDVRDRPARHDRPTKRRIISEEEEEMDAGEGEGGKVQEGEVDSYKRRGRKSFVTKSPDQSPRRRGLRGAKQDSSQNEIENALDTTESQTNATGENEKCSQDNVIAMRELPKRSAKPKTPIKDHDSEMEVVEAIEPTPPRKSSRARKYIEHVPDHNSQVQGSEGTTEAVKVKSKRKSSRARSKRMEQSVDPNFEKEVGQSKASEGTTEQPTSPTRKSSRVRINTPKYVEQSVDHDSEIEVENAPKGVTVEGTSQPTRKGNRTRSKRMEHVINPDIEIEVEEGETNEGAIEPPANECAIEQPPASPAEKNSRARTKNLERVVDPDYEIAVEQGKANEGASEQPPESPTRKSSRTRTFTPKYVEHVVDRYDASSRHQLRRSAKDRCNVSLLAQGESDADDDIHEVMVTLPPKETEEVDEGKETTSTPTVPLSNVPSRPGRHSRRTGENLQVEGVGNEPVEDVAPRTNETVRSRPGRQSRRINKTAIFEYAVDEPAEDPPPSIQAPAPRGRHSRRRHHQSPALKFIEDHSDSDASSSMATRQSSQSRSSTTRQRSLRTSGRKTKEKDTAYQEDEASTSTEEYSNDSGTEDKARRKTKTKLSLRQRNARRKKGSGESVEQDVADTSIEEVQVTEDADETAVKEVEETAENNVEKNEATDGEITVTKDALPSPVVRAVKNLPLKMRIRISRITDEQVEKHRGSDVETNKGSDMDVEEVPPPVVPVAAPAPSAGEEKPVPVRKVGRRGRKPKGRAKAQSVAHSENVTENDVVVVEDTDAVPENKAVNETNDDQVENEKKEEDTEVLHDKPEFSSDSEKEGEAADVQKDSSTCSLVWKTANGESVTESTEAPEPEEEPPKDLGKAMAQKSTGRVGSRKGRGRGRKGRPPAKRARVEETVTAADFKPATVT